jgi:hypothetical protein
MIAVSAMEPTQQNLSHSDTPDRHEIGNLITIFLSPKKNLSHSRASGNLLRRYISIYEIPACAGMTLKPRDSRFRGNDLSFVN